MSNLYWLSENQMVWLRPYFVKSHSLPSMTTDVSIFGAN
jgi:hypothetical protein